MFGRSGCWNTQRIELRRSERGSLPRALKGLSLADGTCPHLRHRRVRSFRRNPAHIDGPVRHDPTCAQPCKRLSGHQVRHRTCGEFPRERSVWLERATACGTLSSAYASGVWCAAALPLESAYIPEWRSYEHLDHPHHRCSDSAIRRRRVLLEKGTRLARSAPSTWCPGRRMVGGRRSYLSGRTLYPSAQSESAGAYVMMKSLRAK